MLAFTFIPQPAIILTTNFVSEVISQSKKQNGNFIGAETAQSVWSLLSRLGTQGTDV
jgi:hypothetical protein